MPFPAPDISAETLAFDELAFGDNYPAELAGDPIATQWLDDFTARKGELGTGFEKDRLCQALCGQLALRQAAWDRQRSAETWKSANASMHSDWMSTNAALMAAGAAGKRKT